MLHWRASAILGMILTGRPVPVCALVHRAPDCRARRAFSRAMDRAFREDQHLRRVHDTWAIGWALRG